MLRSLVSWSRALRDPWLYLLMLVCFGSVALAYRQSTPYEVNLAAPYHPLFLEGFDPPELSPSGAACWTHEQANVRLPNLWPDQAVRLTLVAGKPHQDDLSRLSAPAEAEVVVNGQPIATLPVGPNPSPYELELDSDIIGRAGNLFLMLRTPTSVSGDDSRPVGLLVKRIYAEPLGPASRFPPPETAISLALLVGLGYLWTRRLGADWLTASAASVVLIAAGIVGLLMARPWTTPISNRLVLLIVVAALGTELVFRLSGRQLDSRAYRRVAAILLVAFALRLGIAHWPGNHDDFSAFKMMVKNVTTHSIAASYEIDPAIGAYPPVLQYDFALVGTLYRTFISPTLDVASRRLDLILKMPSIMLDMLIVIVIMVYAARQRSIRVALWAGSLYALNPGIIYVTAYSGWLGDPIYSLFVASAVIALVSEGAGVTGAATALAILTKLQAAAFFPFLTVSAFRNLRGSKPLRAIALGVGVSLLVVAPFLVAGTFGDMMRAMSTAAGSDLRTTSQAFNIWWLVGWGSADILDTGSMLGAMSYRTVGLVLFFGVAYGLIVWKTWWVQRMGDLTLLAAFVGMTFFMLPTDTRADFLFPTFALLALAAVHDPRAWTLGGILTITWSVNLISTDQTLMRSLMAIWPGLATAETPIQIGVAVVNVSVLLLWSYWLLRMGRHGDVMRMKPGIR